MSLIQFGCSENPQEPLSRLPFVRSKDDRRVGNHKVTIVFGVHGSCFKSLILITVRDAPRVDQAPSITGFVSEPMPSIETVTSSPATTGPIPAGVPVKIKSPGSKVMTWEMKRITISIGKMKAVVLSDCLTWPLTWVSTRTPFHGSISSVTIGPKGQKVSKPLARVHWLSFFCRSRAVTSLAQV